MSGAKCTAAGPPTAPSGTTETAGTTGSTHAPPVAADSWAVYLLECADGRVYTGIARNPRARYAKHLAGNGARFTRSNPPRKLLGWVWVEGHGHALRLEIAWKRLPRTERIAALQALMDRS